MVTASSFTSPDMQLRLVVSNLARSASRPPKWISQAEQPVSKAALLPASLHRAVDSDWARDQVAAGLSDPVALRLDCQSAG
jgi:hypothetical protein